MKNFNFIIRIFKSKYLGFKDKYFEFFFKELSFKYKIGEQSFKNVD